MKFKSNIRFVAGLLIWVGLVAGGISLLRRSIATSPVASRQIADYLIAREKTLKLHAPARVVLGIGDPVFLESASGHIQPVGIITELDFPTQPGDDPVKLAWVNDATIKFLGGLPPIGPHDYLQYNSTNDSLGWIGQTMFHAEKRKQITQIIVDAYSDHQDELIDTFEPLIKQTIAQGAKVVAEQIAIEVRKRRDQIQAVSQRYQSDVFEKKILPVLETEVWPIVEMHCRPLATQVGSEIWREVSVWRFGWRYLYDAAPLPERNLSQKEFDRFLQSKVVPILKSHIPDAIELQTVMLKQIAENESLKRALADAGDQVFNDPEVQTLVKEIFTHAIVDNEALKRSIETTWRSDSAIAAMRIANERLQPVVTEIGKSIFGSPRTGITPEFARVLRNRVLHKDQRWLTLKQADPETAIQSRWTKDSASGGYGVTILPLRPAAAGVETPYFPGGIDDE